MEISPSFPEPSDPGAHVQHPMAACWIQCAISQQILGQEDDHFIFSGSIQVEISIIVCYALKPGHLPAKMRTAFKNNQQSWGNQWTERGITPGKHAIWTLLVRDSWFADGGPCWKNHGKLTELFKWDCSQDFHYKKLTWPREISRTKPAWSVIPNEVPLEVAVDLEKGNSKERSKTVSPEPAFLKRCAKYGFNPKHFGQRQGRSP